MAPFLLAIFDWNRIFLNDQPYSFLWEVLFRSGIMFLFLLVALRFSGKRGVKQLSIFETVIIIALGSAAGDPMFYHDVGILPALLVFVIIIVLYRIITYLTGKFKWFENLLEGSPVCLIEEGKFVLAKFEKEALAQDEFFAELRLQNVEHLGQVKNAFIETSGNISVFYYPDEEVKPGLPLLPNAYAKKHQEISKPGLYACTFCGHTLQLEPGIKSCPTCQKKEWVPAIKTLRIT